MLGTALSAMTAPGEIAHPKTTAATYAPSRSFFLHARLYAYACAYALCPPLPVRLMHTSLRRRILSSCLRPPGPIPSTTSKAPSATSVRSASTRRPLPPRFFDRSAVASLTSRLSSSSTNTPPSSSSHPHQPPSMAPKDKAPKFELKTPKGTKDCKSSIA